MYQKKLIARRPYNDKKSVGRKEMLPCRKDKATNVKHYPWGDLLVVHVCENDEKIRLNPKDLMDIIHKTKISKLQLCMQVSDPVDGQNFLLRTEIMHLVLALHCVALNNKYPTLSR